MTEKLKKCPFCGGEAKISHIGSKTRIATAIECSECHAGICRYYYGHDDAEAEVIEAWNMRS